MAIHPTAIVDARAEIGPDVEIGAYAVVDGPVRLGRGTQLRPHAVVLGNTTLGEGNVVHSGAVIGDDPQDLGYSGADTYLEIGDRNLFREHVIIHRGAQAGSTTTVGSDCFFMGHSHAGHNCQIGNRIILANGVLLGGHVQVDDGVFFGGNAVVHQHVRVGRLAILRGQSRTSLDVPPFAMMDGTGIVRGVNVVGLRRAGFSAERTRAIRRAYATLFGRRRHLGRAVAEVEAAGPNEDVRHLLDFIRASKRGVCRAAASGDSGEE